MKSGVKHSEKKKMAQLSAGSDDACIGGAFLIGNGRRNRHNRRHGGGFYLGGAKKSAGLHDKLLGGEGG